MLHFGMNWQILYYNENVKKSIRALPQGLYARFLRMVQTMTQNVPNLGMPHTKSMGDGLFEMRLKAQEGTARVFYCTVVNNKIYLLHSLIKKTQKTLKKDLDIAKKRLKEVK